ncbi:MAG TPA: hypothetical protein PLT28_00400 [Saprospiraceae bacterium]|nr:hypothetical protein [Saprospiraceae bacterium]
MAKLNFTNNDLQKLVLKARRIEENKKTLADPEYRGLTAGVSRSQMHEWMREFLEYVVKFATVKNNGLGEKSLFRRDLQFIVNQADKKIDFLSSTGGYTLRIVFDAASLKRESLFAQIDKKTPYTKSLRNILALFNNGYVSTVKAYGLWRDFDPGASEYIENSGGFWFGRSSRPALLFMQQAKTAFEERYRSIGFDVTVDLGADYYRTDTDNESNE